MVSLSSIRRCGGALLISVVGVSLLGFYVGYLSRNRLYMEGPRWLFAIGLLLVIVIAIGLMYSGYWLVTGPTDADLSWRVAMWCFVGILGALSMTFWPIFYQLAVGVEVEDPVFILIMSTGIGASGGVLIGISEVRTRRYVNRVERARDTFAFLNNLLRHNVLNAMAVIGGYAEEVADRHPAGVTATDIETIRAKSQQITEFIQNIQVFVDRINGRTEPDVVDLSSMVERELDTLRLLYDGVEIAGWLEPEVRVRVDQVFVTVFVDLVSNAIEHNDRPDKRVEVRLTTESEHAVLEIVDNGPGIPVDERRRLFESRSSGNHGLGIYLSNVLITEYGGELSIRENDPRGTVVRIDLPLAS